MKQIKERVESDGLGTKSLPATALHGIHTERALANFPISGRLIHRELIPAFGAVKLAALKTNLNLGLFADQPELGNALQNACSEMMAGQLNEYILVDSLQGGAGTSTNMNVNEVLANRALELLGEKPGTYQLISPLDHVNLHQSTNDTFPTALRLAVITALKQFEKNVIHLQENFQKLEEEFADIAKIGRTQLQDATPVTLGREMGCYAEALARDRWRIYKSEERLRVVNLGGTAVGTGVGAPRQYIFSVVSELKKITGIGFSRAENLMDATQNNDVFVEVSGMIKACAVTLLKICSDLRLLASGPEFGFGEIRLPAMQPGSSIMPGKVNPVIPEAVSQAAMLVMGRDSVVSQAAASGCLELNPFLPLIADCLLDNIAVLSASCRTLADRCVSGIEANKERCFASTQSETARITSLLSVLPYETLSSIKKKAEKAKKTVRQMIIEDGVMTAETYDQLINPVNSCRLGY
jgi:aspartate ammonia-lyase